MKLRLQHPDSLTEAPGLSCAPTTHRRAGMRSAVLAHELDAPVDEILGAVTNDLPGGFAHQLLGTRSLR